MDESEVELLNVGSRGGQGASDTHSTAVRKDGLGRVAALGLVIVLVGGLYALSRSGVEADGAESLTESQNQSATTDAPARSETTTQPTGDDQQNDTRATTSTTKLTGFGIDIGWDLFQHGGSNTSRLNLETGERTVFGGRYTFIANVGDRILVQSNPGVIDLIELKAEEIVQTGLEPSRSSDGFFDSFSFVTEGTDVWLAVQERNSQDWEWERWDLSLDPPEAVETRAQPRSSSRHPSIVSPSSGGVFTIGANQTATRVADGDVRLVTPTHVLVETCADPYNCSLAWLFRGSFEVDETAQPPPNQDAFAFFAGSSPDGQKIVQIFYGDSGPELTVWDIFTGETIDAFGTANNLDRAIVFSPDSRFLAGPSEVGGVIVIDLETGEPVIFPDIGPSESIGFIPKLS